MACDITRDLPPAGGVADMDGVAEVQMLDDGSRVGGVVVHIVAVRYLARPPVTAAINADHPVPLLDKKQHLSVPVIGTERPAMVEDNRLAAPPIFVENLCAVGGCDYAHGLDSIAALRGGFCDGLAAPVMRDAAIAAGSEEEHLVLECIPVSGQPLCPSPGNKVRCRPCDRAHGLGSFDRGTGCCVEPGAAAAAELARGNLVFIGGVGNCPYAM